MMLILGDVVRTSGYDPKEMLVWERDIAVTKTINGIKIIYLGENNDDNR